MRIGPSTAVALEYTLADGKGEVIDRSPPGAPLWYLHGLGSLVPGLERALEGKDQGETCRVELAPHEAYGARDEDLVEQVPRAELQLDGEVEIGAILEAHTDEGVHVATVTAIDADQVTLDHNHPLAGKHLVFTVKIAHVRAANVEELQHGHIHGPGGHHHH